jgi:UDP-glucose:(heptosyl)LPS alpha-1,3-glucosyltransferase
MKIALVNYAYFPSKGGVERAVADIARGLVERGHNVHIFCHRSDAASTERLTFHLVRVSKLTSARKSISFAANSAKMLEKNDFDVIHAFGRTYCQDVLRIGGGCHMEYLKRTESAMGTALGRLFTLASPRNRAILRLEKKAFAPGAYRIITCISKRVKREIMDYYGVADDKAEVIYNCVDLERWRRQVRTAYGIGEEEMLVLFVGSGFRRKGLEYAIRAMAGLRQGVRRKLMVVGKGRLGHYRGLAKDCGVMKDVLFLGPRDHVEEFYAAADVFMMPTLYEPFGTVVLEAMATGIPAITSRVAGASEIVTDGTDGLIVEQPADPAEMAAKLNLLTDAALRERIGEAARRTACGYSIDANVEKNIAIYRRVIEEKAGERRSAR